MTQHEWKPGDVALMQKNGGEWHPGMRNSDNDGWVCYHGIDCGPDAVRPLVAIDPEDRAQVERLESLYLADGHDACEDTVGCMQEALREFANPKPPNCGAALNIKGEHYGCEQPGGHGMAHSNTAAGAIWGGGE